MRFKVYLFSFLQAIVWLLSLVTNWYFQLILLLFVINIVMMLDKLGKGIILRETIALHTTFVCLVMPVAGYVFFDSNSELARLWVKSMPVKKDIYFAYALPAISGFVTILCWPLNTYITDHGNKLRLLIVEYMQVLKNKPNLGLYLMVLGICMYIISGALPVGVHFVSLLFYFASYAGLLYLNYTSDFRFKRPVMTAFIAFIAINAINSGMFTVVAYMGLTLFSFFFVGKKILLWKKITWFLLGVFFLVILQTVKPAYRKITWNEDYSGSKAVLFAELFVEKATTLDLISEELLFPIYVRTNQGFNVALVMTRIPEIQNYDYGNRLFLTFVSAWVPRLFWPDKPEAGGRYNMEHYTGHVIRGWSTNVGPLGEAYGSFGVNGGIMFMILVGLFIRTAYMCVFIVARRVPFILFWIPVMFYQITYSAETDTLQIMNSLIKSTFFVWALYYLWPALFGKIQVHKRGAKFRSERQIQNGLSQ